MIAVVAGIVLLRTGTLKLVMILIASWIFYAAWQPVLLLLLLYCTVNDYLLGLAIASAQTVAGRRRWLVVSLVTNLGVLAVFKYANFFAQSVNQSAAWLGMGALVPALHITLPIGVSFYTLHSMGYNIDVFRGPTQPARSFPRFPVYVAFFPH